MNHAALAARVGPARGDLGGPVWQLLQRALPAVVDQLTPQGRAGGGLGNMQDIPHALRLSGFR